MAAPGLHDRNGIVKGADFLHFYTLGTLALEHRGNALYDMQAQSALADQRVPEAGAVFFVPLYPPQVSLLFAPFAALPYLWALAAWVTFNALLYGACCWLIWRTCSHLLSDEGLIFLLALSYPAFFHVIVWGQTSVLALACFTLAYAALRSGRTFSAGLAIGCLVFKPQLGIAPAFVLLLAGEWRVALGALTSGSAQLLAGWAYYGSSVMRDFWQHLINVRAVMAPFEPRPYQMHSLRAFWRLLLPFPKIAMALWIASTVAVLIIVLVCWKRGASLRLRFSALLVATVLVSPHFTVYDLTILAPAFLLLADEAIADHGFAKRAGLLLYLCYVLPLIGPLSVWTHVQVSVPAMAALLWVIYRSPAGEDRATSSGEAAGRFPVSAGFGGLH
jgi:alpha-1,2-mannosyltransferase